jgi:hypothetical protein
VSFLWVVFYQNSPLRTPFSTKMEEILEEIRELRQIIATLQPSPPLAQLCEGVTGKGTQCRNRASPDSCYCRMHLGRRVERVAKVSRAAKKVKKVQPEHTCGEGGGGVCMLCETHGDVWDPELVGVGFEGCVEI